ncbi:MAG: hypothetical protein Q9P14_06325 [candidate division KSB1 bacterium]|nr:hypothetical protein [candidate division KSB1 bacterium]
MRQVMRQAEIEEVEANDTEANIGSSIRRMFKPEKGAGAEMLEGSPEEIAEKIIKILQEKGIKK